MFVKRFRLFLGLALAAVAVITTVNFAFASQGTAVLGDSSNAQAATMAATMSGTMAMASTMAGTMSIPSFPQCMEPTPTPGGTTAPTMAATMAAMPATMAATMSGTMAMASTKAATMAATKAAPTKAPTATKVPPTATPIPKGKKPATAGITLNFAAGEVRSDGSKCVGVLTTLAGGPASAAGIKAGDYVLGIDATEVKTASDFYAEVAKHVSGDTVTVTVQREEAVMLVKVVLGLNPYAK